MIRGLPSNLYLYVSYGAIAFIIALFVTPLMRQTAFAVGAVDKGAGRRAHQGIVPRLGGVAIYLAVVLPMIAVILQNPKSSFNQGLTGILSAGTLVFAVGVLDDIRGVRVRTKLLVEIVAALMVYGWGMRILNFTNPFGDPFSLGWLSLPVTVLWILVITNAVNLIDGLDGLAAGTGILIAMMLFMLSGERDVYQRIVPLILAGGLLGFLRHNFPPATIFMGDSGSLFLGFFLASFSILFSAKATAVATMMVPILAFTHPILDMTYAVLRRAYRGMPLSEPDREHIHHKLLEKGLSKRTVLLLLYLANGVLMTAIMILIGRNLDIGLIGLLFLAVAAIVGMKFLGYIEVKTLAVDTVRHFDMNNKRRFYYYQIRRFSRIAGSVSGFDGLRDCLDGLMEVYGFRKVEIRLNGPPSGEIFYSYEGDNGQERGIDLSFPVMIDGRAVGTVSMVRGEGDEPFLCVGELSKAVAREVGSFLDRQGRRRDAS